MRSVITLAILCLFTVSGCGSFGDKIKKPGIEKVVSEVKAGGVKHLGCETGVPLGNFVGAELEKVLKVQDTTYASTKGIAEDLCVFAVKKAIPLLLAELDQRVLNAAIRADGCSLTSFREDLEGGAYKLCGKIQA